MEMRDEENTGGREDQSTKEHQITANTSKSDFIRKGEDGGGKGLGKELIEVRGKEAKGEKVRGIRRRKGSERNLNEGGGQGREEKEKEDELKGKEM